MSFGKYFSILLLIILIFFVAACYPSLLDSGNSSNAKLDSITIKGVSADLGTPHAELGKEIAGLVNILDTSTGFTGGTPIDDEAEITKIVQFAVNEDFHYVDEFPLRAAYADEAINTGDFFVFLVSARDESVLYYRINVRSGEADFIYTLNESNVENETLFENVRFFLNVNTIDITPYTTETSYETIAADFGSPISNILASSAASYLYAFEFTEKGSGTLQKAGVSAVTLFGTPADESLVVNLSPAALPPSPPPPAFDPDNPIPSEPIPYDYFGDYINTITGDSASNPVTIKLEAITFSNESSPMSGVKAWGDLNNIIQTKGKYIILDLSNCTAVGNTIFGNASPGGNDMNIIQHNTFLKEIILPSNLETIGNSAFTNCDELTSITIPSSVNLIEANAFDGCTADLHF